MTSAQFHFPCFRSTSIDILYGVNVVAAVSLYFARRFTRSRVRGIDEMTTTKRDTKHEKRMKTETEFKQSRHPSCFFLVFVIQIPLCYCFVHET